MVNKLFLIALFVVLIDRISKYFLKYVNYLFFKGMVNKGAAFSLLQNWNLFLIIFAILVIILIIYYKDFKEHIALGLFLG